MVYCHESMQTKQAKGRGLPLFSVERSEADIKANFLSLVLCGLCAERKQALLVPGAMGKLINLMR